MKKKQAVEIKSTVSNKLNVTSLEIFADDMMAHLGRGRLDLSRPRTRERLRAFFLSNLKHLAWHLQRDFAKAAERGMSEMAHLIRDFDYYETVRERRAQARDSRKTDLAQRVAVSRRAAARAKRLSARKATDDEK